MAITKSAKKEIRASKRKHLFNLRTMRTMRKITKLTKKLAIEGKSEEAREQYRSAQKAIDKASKRGVIKQKTGSRKKAVLARAIQKNG